MSDFVKGLLREYLDSGKKHDILRSFLIGPYSMGVIPFTTTPFMVVGSVCNDESRVLLWQFPIKATELDLRNREDDFFLDPINLFREGLEVDDSSGPRLCFSRYENLKPFAKIYPIISVLFSVDGMVPDVEQYGKEKQIDGYTENNKSVIDRMMSLYASGLKTDRTAEQHFEERPISDGTKIYSK